MAEPDTQHDREIKRESTLAAVRIFLGQAQIIGAVASVYLLIQEGLSTRTVGFVLFTCSCTTTSVLLFGSRDSRGS